MSLYEYRESLKISADDPGFYALIMAAALKADDINYRKLLQAWPELMEERRERYNAPGGLLPGEEEKVGDDRYFRALGDLRQMPRERGIPSTSRRAGTRQKRSPAARHDMASHDWPAPLRSVPREREKEEETETT